MNEYLIRVEDSVYKYTAISLEEVALFVMHDFSANTEFEFVSYTSSEYLNRKEEIDDKIRAYEMAVAYQGNRAEND